MARSGMSVAGAHDAATDAARARAESVARESYGRLLALLARARGARPCRAAVVLAVPGADRFQPAWATRAHLLAQAGRATDARVAYQRAIALCADAGIRSRLQEQCGLLGTG